MVREQLRSKMAYSLYVPLVAIVQNGLTFAVLCLGGFYVTRGQMSGSDLTAFLFYSQTVQVRAQRRAIAWQVNTLLCKLLQ
jgi:ABC-type bacteriocin/lantibiotic exporter with double-glycine peptidase domain